jgi:hypothetical protein
VNDPEKNRPAPAPADSYSQELEARVQRIESQLDQLMIGCGLLAIAVYMLSREVGKGSTIA